MRTVYLGTSDFAAGILRELAGTPHRPTLVVTRPDRPRGRGRRLAAPPVADTARDLGIDLDQPDNVNSDEARARIAAAEPDTVLVCAFGALIKEPLLSEHPMLNVHPSLLPRWRGAAPVERAIMAGDETTGVSIMRLTAGLDSGPVCAEAQEPIAPDDTYGTLAERLMTLGGRLLIETLDEQPACHEQDEAQATYAEKLTAQDRVLDPRRPAAELELVVRGLSPHIGAAVNLADGTRLGVWEARVQAPPEAAAAAGAGATADVDVDVDVPAQPEPGELDTTGSLPVLGCAEGALELVLVQPPGRRAMSGADYLRGRRS